ncbi:MAG TPA: hypothetical protein VNJ01_03815 [Bacteriovoracaceae bacterium]|nr:hypothetical protein [Bacteriovoracaceae bacterium]
MSPQTSLQQKTIQRYRQFFPEDTLREISSRTGIQITRVFRLMNGKNMKVGELEAFERAVTVKTAENPNFAHMSTVIESASAVLTNEELGKIADYVQRKVANRTFGRMYIRSTYQDMSIA